MNTGRWSPSSVNPGDEVKVLCGTFAGLKGVVREVSTSRGMAQVELQLDRRSMAVELELWQLERASER